MNRGKEKVREAGPQGRSDLFGPKDLGRLPGGGGTRDDQNTNSNCYLLSNSLRLEGVVSSHLLSPH